MFVSIFLCLKNFFPQVSDSLSLLLYSLHVRLLRASVKINPSINQSSQHSQVFFLLYKLDMPFLTVLGDEVFPINVVTKVHELKSW